MRERMRSFFTSNSTIRRVREFLNSNEYPPLVALGVFLCYVSGFEIFGMISLIFITSFGMMISRDMKCVIPPLFIVPFILPLKHTPGIPTYSDYYFQTWILVMAVVCGIVLLSGFVLHYVLWRDARDAFLKPTRLTPYLLVLSVGLLLNGVGASGWGIHDFLTGLSLVALWGVLYLVFLRGIQFNKEMMTYICRVCQWLVILLIAELLYVISVNPVIADGTIQKDQIVFGWGIQNNFAGILVWLLPPIFYIAATEKAGWRQLLLSALMMFSIFFSMCRSALLVGIFVYVACLLVCCATGKNKILFRMFSVGCLFTTACVLLFSYDRLVSVFAYYSERGTSDSGRFTLWRDAMQNFFKYPILGAGFHATPFESWAGRNFGYCHNTVIQLFSAGGMIAGVAYLLMRLRTIWMAGYRLSLERVFLGLMMVGLLGVGLLDNHMFNIYPCFFYAIGIACIEQDYLACLTPKDENILRRAIRKYRETKNRDINEE